MHRQYSNGAPPHHQQQQQHPSSTPPTTYSHLQRGSSSATPGNMYLPHPHPHQHYPPQHPHHHLAPHHHPHAHAHPYASYPPASPPQQQAQAEHASSNGNGNARAQEESEQQQPAIAYAATGRKRKRLQKACIACHKAKRRCDGGLPCSNCDFSGRTCCYSDASGNIVPPTPTVARPAASPAAPVQVSAPVSVQPPTQASYAQFQQPHPQQVQKRAQQSPVQQARAPRGRADTASSSSRPTAKAAAGLPSSPSSSTSDELHRGPSAPRRMHLLSTFFNTCYPFNQTLDEVALLKEMGLGKEGSVSDVLLFAVYALAARFAPSEHEGEEGEEEAERYARRARALLAQRQEERERSYEDDDGEEEEKIETDAIYASAFLAACDILSAKHSRAAVQTSTAWRMITLLGLERGQLPHLASASRVPRTATLLRKLVVVTYMLDVFASVFTGQPPAASSEASRGFFKLFAPVPSSSSSSAPSSTAADGASASASVSGDASISALLHACASIDVFRSVVSSARSRSSSSSSASRQDDRSHALSIWAAQLPSYLLFNESILRSATREFHDAAHSSRAVEPKLAAWATMHLFAETSNLILLFSSAAERRTSAEATASQIAAAKNNIGHVLEAMGPAGRAGHIFAFPAALAATFSSSFGSAGNDRRYAGHENRLAWWADCRQLFRLSEEKVRFIVARLGLEDASSSSSSPTFSRPTPSPSYSFLSNDRRLENGAAASSHPHSSFFGASFRSNHASVPAQRSPSSGSGNASGLVLPPLPSLRLSPASRQSDEGLSLRLSPISSASQHPTSNGNSANRGRHVSHSPPTPALSLTRGSRTESVSSSSQQDAESPAGSTDGAAIFSAHHRHDHHHHSHHHHHGSESAARSSFHLHDEHSGDASEEMAAKRPRFSASFSDSGVVAPKCSALISA